MNLKMNFKLLISGAMLVLLTLASVPALAASPVADNSEQLVGIWDILDANDTVLDSIDVTIVVAKKSTARFSYRQLSLSSETNSLEGFLTNDTVVFDLINLGQAQTYIAKIDFDLAGGPGFQVKTRLADCVDGVESAAVLKKFRSRLADDSARCDGFNFNDSAVTNIKLVKRGVSTALVSSTASVPVEISAEEAKFAKRVEAAWSVHGNGSQRRLVIKDISSTHLGYRFTYRLLNNTTKLANLSEGDFETADRVGFIVNDYMVINPTLFSKRNELFIIKLDTTLEKGLGREVRTDNGDCFPFKVNVIGVMACTPNDSSSLKTSSSKRIEGQNAMKIDTNLIIVF